MRNGFGLGGIFARALDTNFEIRSAKDFATTHPKNSHEYWMAYALQVSMNAIGWTCPNPAVGCVIVKDEKVIAEGFTQAYRHEHAERMAFRKITEMNLSPDILKDAVVYVTLEPCSHTGFQPPCVELLLQSPIQTIVIACIDADARVHGQGIEKLKQAGKTVIVGVLEQEARAWHFPFLKNKTTGRPVWIAKWAQTADGFLADAQGNSKWITNEKSRAYTHWLRQKYDAILVGAGTWLHDQPRLDVRDCAQPQRRNPIRFVFDPRGTRVSAKDAGTASVENPVFLFTCRNFLPKNETLASGMTRVVIEENFESVRLIEAFQQVVENQKWERPLQSIFCEGGPALLNLLLKADVFSAIHQFVGVKKFSTTDERYQLLWQPNQDWARLSTHNFADDYLHEWVNCR